MEMSVWLPYGIYFAPLVRAYLAFILLKSATEKFMDMRYFLGVVSSYKILPGHTVRPFAFILPCFESILGGLLLVGWQTRLSAALLALLMMVFILAIYINLVRGRHYLDCGCSGSRSKHKISNQLIMRDALIILLSLYLVIIGGGFLALDNRSLIIQPQILEKAIINSVLPIGLSGAGLYLIYCLLRRLFLLMRLNSPERKTR
jgi:uncharacterized membrane protein YphA (DoxX/SURF4 family)